MYLLLATIFQSCLFKSTTAAFSSGYLVFLHIIIFYTSWQVGDSFPIEHLHIYKDTCENSQPPQATTIYCTMYFNSRATFPFQIWVLWGPLWCYWKNYFDFSKSHIRYSTIWGLERTFHSWPCWQMGITFQLWAAKFLTCVCLIEKLLQGSHLVKPINRPKVAFHDKKIHQPSL